MVKQPTQPVSAVQDWKERMRKARALLPDGVGQQQVLLWIAKERPAIDRLTNAARWHRAWLGRVADPEFTQLVEAASVHFQKQQADTRTRLARQKLKKSV